jgi:hypothetical protein
MGTTRTLADGEAFVQGRSQATAEALVTAAADAGLKGSVKTTYDGYIAPSEVVEAAGFASASSTESSTPENPADHSDEANAKYEGDADLFDPAKSTIAEVKTYLEDADDVERARVIDAEKASAKPRQGVLDLATTPEGDK